MTLYDGIARFYDPWSRSVTEDVGFYVEQALASGGPSSSWRSVRAGSRFRSLAAGVSVIGVDTSPEMLQWPVRRRTRRAWAVCSISG